MKTLTRVCTLALLIVGLHQLARGDEAPPPIEKVEIRPNRALYVNGQPFFPLMAWLQDSENFPAVAACGMNTTAGYWPGSGGTKDVTEYLQRVADANLYGVLPFDPRLKGHPNLLAYIHDDEPDLPHQVSDATVVPADHLRINSKTPLWKLVDGVTHTWSVLDPLQDAAVIIQLKRPITVESLAVWPTVSQGLSLPKDVIFRGDGKEILQATLQEKKGQQKFSLPGPATFSSLEIIVRSVFPGEQVWGSIGEVEGFDAAGENVLLSPPRHEPRAQPEVTMEKYQAVRTADASRPVFLTLTGHFHPHFNKWTDQQRATLYPAYIAASDVVGYDIYPIYGWNKPEWIHLVRDATDLLVEKAGPRPVYAWIETSKGSQWTGPLERQKDVTPQHIRAEVWMAVTSGATAIGYFTHVWKPAYHQFGVPEENRKAIREINDQITRLAPAILSEKPERSVGVEPEGDVKVDVLARQHGSGLYLFAVNYDERLLGTKARLTVDGLPAGTKVEVIDEDRTIRAGAGRFSDVFDPLAVHIYRIGGE